jgi:formyl-CoA transferase
MKRERRRTASNAHLPLHGIKVVAFEQAVAAPLCSRHLADLGADVIKVERRGEGDFARAYDSAIFGTSTWYAWLNRGKRSLSLDMKHPRGREVAERLVAAADVVVQNFAPGAFDRLGLGISQLHERYPSLIVASVTGYGEDGPYRDRKAYDLLLQAEAGVLSITGSESEPAKSGVSLVDLSAGIYTFGAVMTALYRRERTGEGAAIRVSLFDAIMEWMTPFSLMAQSGSAPKRTGARHASIVPYGPYGAGGGKQVVLAVQNEREWQRLCRDVLQSPQLATDPRFASNELRARNRDALEPEIEAILSSFGVEEAETRLEAASIAYSRLNDVREVMTHPQVLARGRLLATGIAGGQVDLLRAPFNIEGAEELPSEIASIGQHTGEILRELGYSDQEIAALKAGAAV